MQLFGVGAGAGSSRRRYSTIIVLDEIDMLMTKDQAVSTGKQQQPWSVPWICQVTAAWEYASADWVWLPCCGIRLRCCTNAALHCC
jgi:hypothetical protein